MSAEMWVGDVLDWARRYDGPPFHALLCDPPYELAFMSKTWDATGVAFRPETWAALAEHLHPGGFGMAFASSRGWHRMACAIEDAGLVFHPSIFMLGWVAGSGFPKATRIRDNGHDAPGWETHRYGMQALKPSLEPVICFQRPYAGRPVDCITATGAGAWNVDGGRIGTEESTERPSGVNVGVYGRDDRWGMVRGSTAGRWPAHVALVHTPACTPDACADGCAVKALGEMSGELTSGTGAVKNASGAGYQPSAYGRESRAPGTPNIEYGDSGSAARFFHNADYFLEHMADEPPFRYAAKADRWEREAGLEGPEQVRGSQFGNNGARPHTAEDYRYDPTRRNIHPTVKPLALLHWLATLLLPPDAYAPRRLLVPFAGSGSEMIAAWLTGWEDVQGIEQSTEYAAIAWQRLAFWQQFVGAQTYAEAQERARAWATAEDEREAREVAGQLPLFADLEAAR